MATAEKTMQRYNKKTTYARKEKDARGNTAEVRHRGTRGTTHESRTGGAVLIMRQTNLCAKKNVPKGVFYHFTIKRFNCFTFDSYMFLLMPTQRVPERLCSVSLFAL